MRTSKKKLAFELEGEVLKNLLNKVKNINSFESLEKFFNTLFTPSEKEMVLKRLAAMILISKGEKYRDIQEKLEVSKDTISKASDLLEGRAYGVDPNRHRKESQKLNLKIDKKRKRIFPEKYKGAKSIIPLP